jgi:anti-sigma regulatory factor (Ser/Thr protein kinase)
VTTAFAHEAAIYDGLEGFLDIVVPFVREGVGRGEPTMVAVPGDRLGPLRSALGDTADLVTFAEMEVIGRNPGRIIPAWADFLDGGRRPMRGVGEPVWADRSADELEECQRHEHLLNVAFADAGPFTLLCPYDAATLPAGVVDAVAHAHPVVTHGGVRGSSPSCASLAEMAGPHRHALPPPPPDVTPFPFSSLDVHEVRLRVEKVAHEADLSASAVESLVLSAHEIATNSIRHGGGRGTLQVWRTERSVVVQIDDGGHLTDPLAGRRRPTLTGTGGRGLWMAHQLTDLLQIRDTTAGTTVRLHQHLP